MNIAENARDFSYERNRLYICGLKNNQNDYKK